MKIWKRYAPSSSLPWNFERAKHLHRRAAFGATWDELERDSADGPDESVERLLHGTSRISNQRDDFDEIASIIGDSAARSGNKERLKAWWLFRILFTSDPLREKLTLLWHNHFATSNLKVQNLPLMQQQNELFREYASSRFAELLQRILRDPATLQWLDANSNRKGQPNENLARELMELFTLGVGNYSENDVKESARALTGFSTTRGEVTFRADRHDDGEKTILNETRRFTASSLASLLLQHPATSRRLAWRLCGLFMGERVVGQSAMEELASGLRARDLDIGWAVETILRSELFFSEQNIASRVSSPVEFVAGTVRSLEMLDNPPNTLILAEWCARLGQDLFYPPNVGGWNGGRAWLTSRTIVGRANFAAAVVSGDLQAPQSPPPLQQLAQKLGGNHRSAFQRLLLSKPCRETGMPSQSHSVSEDLAMMLSCPEAFLT